MANNEFGDTTWYIRIHIYLSLLDTLMMGMNVTVKGKRGAGIPKRSSVMLSGYILGTVFSLVTAFPSSDSCLSNQDQ